MTYEVIAKRAKHTVSCPNNFLILSKRGKCYVANSNVDSILSKSTDISWIQRVWFVILRQKSECRQNQLQTTQCLTKSHFLEHRTDRMAILLFSIWVKTLICIYVEWNFTCDIPNIFSSSASIHIRCINGVAVSLNYGKRINYVVKCGRMCVMFANSKIIYSPSMCMINTGHAQIPHPRSIFRGSMHSAAFGLWLLFGKCMSMFFEFSAFAKANLSTKMNNRWIECTLDLNVPLMVPVSYRVYALTKLQY